MTSYLGRHAELYDVFYGDKPYGQEAAFVASLLRAHAANCRKLIDVACGTGSHAFELEALGFDVTGADHSSDMLAVARSKAVARRSNVEFVEQDMRHLELGRQYEAAICLFDSLGYAKTNGAVLDTLAAIATHLEPGAPLVLEVWHAAGMLCDYSPVRERRWDLADRRIERRSVTAVDVERQTATVTYTITEVLDDGTSSSITESQTNRFFLAQELALLLTTSGFEGRAMYGGYEHESGVEPSSFHIVAVATRS